MERKETSQRNWSGVDVAKEHFDASLVRAGQKVSSADLREVPVQTFMRSPEGVRAYLDWLDSHVDARQTVRVVMESTGNYSTELAIWMLQARPSLAPAIENAYYTAKYIESCGARNKTDRLEARLLGFYGMEREPAAYDPPTGERRKLRELSRFRDALIQQQTAEKNRMSEGVQTAFVRTMRQRRLKSLAQDIAKVEAEIKRLIQATPDLKKDYDRLCSIYGVAFVTAVVILAELGDLRRFGRARKLTAFVGMSPRIKQSGSSVFGRIRLCKRGNSRVRQALYMAAMAAVRGRNDLQRVYQQLLLRGKTPMAALAVVMRKLLCAMRSLLIHETDYNPLWKTNKKEALSSV